MKGIYEKMGPNEMTISELFALLGTPPMSKFDFQNVAVVAGVDKLLFA